MGWYGLLLLIALPAYFVYAVYSTLREVRRRRDEAVERFGTFHEHPQEDFETLHAQWGHQKERLPHAVDDITWNDLNMDQVFHRINSCLTSPGEETLYQRLRAINGPEEGWEDSLNALDKDPALRRKIQMLLLHLGKNSESGLSELVDNPDGYRLPYPHLIRAASLLPLLAAASFFFSPQLGLLLIFPALLLSAALSYWGDRQLQGRKHTARYANALLWCAKKLSRLPMPGLEQHQQALANAYRPFARLRGALSGTMQEGMAAGDAMALMAFFRFFLLMDLTGYNRAMAAFAHHGEELKQLYDTVGRLDVMICTLSLRKSLPRFCRPRFTKEMAMDVQEAVHPLLKSGVPNSAALTRGTLITGSNASGKSTFIKTLAVNAILAQSLGTCTAASFSLPRAQVMSSMALRDDLLSGDSYFVVEIKSFRRILQAVEKAPCLCFVDEILRGTNTIERIAASAAVLKSLQRENSLCVAATHDIELAGILADQYDNYHFREELSGKAVHFDYLLRPGPSRTRNALLLLDAFDFPAQVVEKAKGMVDDFEREHRWPAKETVLKEASEGGDSPAPAQAG
jgi:hypothetical protein